VSGYEDPALAALDAHICAQLTGAASDYETHTDLQALLAAILAAERHSGDGSAAADSQG
jgi:hypothetical protein